MALGAMISVYGYCAMAMVSVPRLTYAMAEQGDLPRPFAWVHPRFRTPAVSIVVFAVLAWGLAVQGSLLQNLSLSAVSRLSTYGLVCAALPVLRWRERKGDAASPPALLRLPAGPALAVIGVLSSLVLATRMSGREALLLAVVVVLALVHWLAVRRS
jgi:amino acid transporter